MKLNPKRNLFPNRVKRGAVNRGVLAVRSHKHIPSGQVIRYQKIKPKNYTGDTGLKDMFKLLLIVGVTILYIMYNLSKY